MVEIEEIKEKRNFRNNVSDLGNISNQLSEQYSIFDICDFLLWNYVRRHFVVRFNHSLTIATIISEFAFKESGWPGSAQKVKKIE